MCIICNATIGDTAEEALRRVGLANDFLRSYSLAQQAMKKAAADLHALAMAGIEAEDRARYDHHHKRMKGLIREWNQIEHRRESPL